MQSSSGESERAWIGPGWFPVSFPIAVALVILAISLGYALLFSRLVYISLLEQHIDPGHVRLRYEGPLHFHSPAEWVLLATPAVLGWVGTLGSLSFLVQRWRRRAPEP